MQIPLTQKHAFLSYMHENKVEVDELQEALEAAGIQVWRDTRDLWPGEDWQSKIRAAIKADSLAFIACFSTAAEAREKSYQNEELTLAVEEYRLRPPNSSWLFTVRFNDCSVPDFDLGAGRSLQRTIQRTDLFGDGKTVQTIRLSQAVGRVVNPTAAPTVTTDVVADAKRASSSSRERAETLKRLLRDPLGDIALDDFMSTMAKDLDDQFRDEKLLPAQTAERDWVPFSSLWLGEIRDYERALEPAFDSVRIASAYGQRQHNAVWERFMRRLAVNATKPDGTPALLHLRGYPALALMYVAAISAVSRRNYGPLEGFAVAPTLRSQFDRDTQIPLVRYVNVRSVAENVAPIASALAMADDGAEVTSELILGLNAKTVGNRHTPISDHLYNLLRDLFKDELASDDDYAEAFDRAEVLLDALSTDAGRSERFFGGHDGGYGRYTWRYRHTETPIESRMLGELSLQGAAWRPVADGLFGADVERATAALQRVSEYAANIRSRHW